MNLGREIIRRRDLCVQKKICERKTALRRIRRKIVVLRTALPRYEQIGGKWHCWTCYVHEECNTDLETPDVVRRLGQISKSTGYANRRGNGTAVCDLYLLAAPHPRRTSRKITELSEEIATRQYREQGFLEERGRMR